MRKNAVKQALKEGKLQLGTGFGQFRSPDVPRILAAAGFTWAFIDTEHGGFDLETVQDICRISALVGFCPIVRVSDLQYSLVARSLDEMRQICERAPSTSLVDSAARVFELARQGVFNFGPPTSANSQGGK